MSRKRSTPARPALYIELRATVVGHPKTPFGAVTLANVYSESDIPPDSPGTGNQTNGAVRFDREGVLQKLT